MGGEKRRSRCLCARAAGMRLKTFNSRAYGQREERAFGRPSYRESRKNSVRLESRRKRRKVEEKEEKTERKIEGENVGAGYIYER